MINKGKDEACPASNALGDRIVEEGEPDAVIKERSRVSEQRVRTSSADRLDSNRLDERRAPNSTPERTRTSAVQRSRSSVEGLRPASRGTPPTAHGRKSSAQEERLQQLMKRLESLDSHSAASSVDTSPAPRTQPPPTSQHSASRQFSRENIQNTIDNARRWASTEHATPSPAPAEQTQHLRTAPVSMTSSYEQPNPTQSRNDSAMPEHSTQGIVL